MSPQNNAICSLRFFSIFISSAGDSNEDEDINDIELTEVIDGTNKIFLEIDGKKVFKASILKQIRKDSPLSNDRLRKVRGFSRFVEQEKERNDLNNVVSLGDPILVKQGDLHMMSVVIKIQSGEINVRYVPASDLQHLSIKVMVRSIKLKEVDNFLYATGSYASECVTVLGKNCTTVKPFISLNPPEGMYPLITSFLVFFV